MIARIGKYTIEKELGHGGFGDVFLAFDPDVEQKVAIKLLRVELGSDPDMLKRFQYEIRTTASLRHKNIVAIFAGGVENGNPYLVMEFLEGQNLRDIIRSKQPLTLLKKVELMTQVAEGLAFAHSKGIVHRDVKPENIMLLPDDSVKIMDFGIALAPDRSRVMTETGGLIGTLLYFAPEQLEGSKANEQTDIFSLGDVYYELLTGEHPFARNKHDQNALWTDIRTYDPPAVSQLAPGCPEALEFVVHTMIAKDRGIRYATFKEFLFDSKSILVDIRRERAIALLREVTSLAAAGDLQAALGTLDEAQELDPGNREARQFREVIHRAQAQGRVAELLAETESLMVARRFAEAVERLELAARLDSANVAVQVRLGEAKSKLDSSVRASRLVSEARLKQQQGQLTEARERLTAALAIDPDHTEAGALCARVRELVEHRARENRLQEAIQTASQHLAARRFTEALSALVPIEKEQPGTPEVAQLRVRIEQTRGEDERRLRTEQFNLAITRTREAMQAGELDRAGQMIDHLSSNYGSEPSAAGVLPALREQLYAQIRAQRIAACRQQARDLLQRKSYREALDLLADALRKFPDDTGLSRLDRSAADLYQAHQRSEAIASAMNEAVAMRDAGDFRGALDAISATRRRLGDEPSFVDVARQLEMEVEQQRYASGLEELLDASRELMAAGKYSQAIDRIAGAQEYSGEAEVRALLESARVSEVIAEERRVVAEALAAAASLSSDSDWPGALNAVEQALARYPHALALTQTADRLRDQIARERRRAAIEKHRSTIRLEIQDNEWKSAEAALLRARSEFPSGNEFDDLAAQLDVGLYNARLDEVASRVREKLAASNLPVAVEQIEATRTVFSHDPRWKSLAEEVARRKVYEEALLEAEHHRKKGDLPKAETLLTTIIREGPPDQRATQILHGIQAERSEAARQAEIAAITEKLREFVRHGDLDQAAGELEKARATYPDQAVWATLQADIEAGQALLRRQAEIPVLAENVRNCLKREDVRQAVAELAAARAKYPGEGLWTALQGEIEAQQALLRRRAEVAGVVESLRGCLKRNDIRQATALLDAARTTYPNESVWDAVQSEIEGLQVSLTEAEIAALAASIRGWLQRNDFPPAATTLSAARAKYQDRAIWATLQSEIDARQALLQRQAEIAAVLDRVRGHLALDEIPPAVSELLAARSKYPDESVWATLEAEIDARQELLKRRVEIAAIAESVRGRLERDDLREAAGELSAARAKYPGESLWAALEAGIDARQAVLQRQAEIAAIAQGVREHLKRDDTRHAASDLASARSKYPDESLWAMLRTELDARQAFLKEQAAIAKIADEARKLADAGKFAKAQQVLSRNLKQFPGLQTIREEMHRRQRERELEDVRIQAEALLGKGKPEETIVLIENRHATEPCFQPLLTRARTELEARRNQDKQESERREPEDGQGADRMGRIASHQASIDAAMGTRDWAAAFEELDAAQKQFPDERILAELRAKVSQAVFRGEMEGMAAVVTEAFARGDLDGAERALVAGANRFSEESLWRSLQEELQRRRHYIALLTKVEGLVSQGDHASAEELLREAIQDKPPDRRAAELLKHVSIKALAARAKRSRRLVGWTVAAGLVLGTLYAGFVLGRRPPPKPPTRIALAPNPARLDLNCTVGSPAFQRVINWNGRGIGFRASIRSATGDWLAVVPDKGDSLDQLVVTVNAKNLPPGNYDATIVVEPLNGTGAPRTLVPVVLTVEGATTPIENAAPTPELLEPIKFAYTYGKTTPPQRIAFKSAIGNIPNLPSWLKWDGRQLFVNPIGLGKDDQIAILSIVPANRRQSGANVAVYLHVNAEVPVQNGEQPKAEPPMPEPPKPASKAESSNPLRCEFSTAPYNRSPSRPFIWEGQLMPQQSVDMCPGAVTRGTLNGGKLPWVPGRLIVESPHDVKCIPDHLINENRFTSTCINESTGPISTIKLRWVQDK